MRFRTRERERSRRSDDPIGNPGLAAHGPRARSIRNGRVVARSEPSDTPSPKQSRTPKRGDGSHHTASPVTEAERKHYEDTMETLKHELGYQVSFDILIKETRIGDRRASIVSIDSMVDSTVLTLVMEFFMHDAADVDDIDQLTTLIAKTVPYIEVEKEKTLENARDQVLAGPALVVVEGFREYIVMDVRKYPDRNPSEPSVEKVIRGPRDGFVETLIFNTALIRRRIRDPRLRLEAFQVGSRSKSDVVMLYIEDVAHKDFVDTMRHRIQSINVDGLTMSEKALEEWVMKKPWWNPFPTSRFTERPDVAAEHLLEGHVLVVADTSPNALIVPVSFFSFLQSVEEYHEGVMVGSYLKWVRTLGVLISLVGPPLWYALVESHVHLPSPYTALLTPTGTSIPLFWQLIFTEVGVDLLRLALMFSPDSLSQSMGFFGAVILGDIAVKAKFLDAEVLIYVAVAAVGTFAAPDVDFGMAVRMYRMVLLLLVGGATLIGLPWVGFGIGLAGFLLLVANTRSLTMSYLWPLLPFDLPGLLAVLTRKPLNRNVKRPSITLPRDRHRQPS